MYLMLLVIGCIIIMSSNVDKYFDLTMTESDDREEAEISFPCRVVIDVHV